MDSIRQVGDDEVSPDNYAAVGSSGSGPVAELDEISYEEDDGQQHAADQDIDWQDSANSHDIQAYVSEDVASLAVAPAAPDGNSINYHEDEILYDEGYEEDNGGEARLSSQELATTDAAFGAAVSFAGSVVVMSVISFGWDDISIKTRSESQEKS